MLRVRVGNTPEDFGAWVYHMYVYLNTLGVRTELHMEGDMVDATSSK